MTLLLATECGCTHEYYSGPRPKECGCGNRLRTEAERTPKERQPLRRISPKRQAEYDSGERRNTGSTLKAGRGFSVAAAQKRAMKGRSCIVCGKDEAEAIIDPAHVTPRRLAPHCDCEKGVVPLCREHHDAYDQPGGGFDLLPHLMAHGLLEETVHGFLQHGLSLPELLNAVTGEKWVPRSEVDRWKARVVELEGAIGSVA